MCQGTLVHTGPVPGNQAQEGSEHVSDFIFCCSRTSRPCLRSGLFFTGPSTRGIAATPKIFRAHKPCPSISNLPPPHASPHAGSPGPHPVALLGPQLLSWPHWSRSHPSRAPTTGHPVEPPSAAGRSARPQGGDPPDVVEPAAVYISQPAPP
uniref:Uncharacterized protein n=1 Tax=Pelusios castaneus TaxID=367368 RepID=A0A8C8SIJ2_9SAUR